MAITAWEPTPACKPLGIRGKPGWRLVCHSCGKQWPPVFVHPVGSGHASALSPCCPNPRIHFHDIGDPCKLCVSDDILD